MASRPSVPAGRFTLVAVGTERTWSWPLPATGSVVLGSDPSCDCVVEHPSVAPRHAQLDLGDQLRLRALSGDRATQLRGASLAPGRVEAVRPGEVVQLGEVVLVVQARAGFVQKRIWTHGYFESRVEEECVRAERSGASFAVLRIRAVDAPSQEVEDRLAEVLRLVDGVSDYGPGEFEALLIDATVDGARLASERIRERLQLISSAVSVGAACFPADGREPQALMALAGERAHGESAPQADPLPKFGAMPKIEELVARIAATDINVLILGETGVGKERLAESIHRRSPRADRPFLGLNVTALSESLLESELFGHERGAFTGAHQAKPGLFETADGGTVLLDEVAEMPLSTQAKLLRVLETRQVMRVGGIRTRTIDIRVVSATNRDVDVEIAKATFRQDLFYRLNGVTLLLPPLRERSDEMEALAAGFVEEFAKKYGRPAPRLGPEALALMRRYTWPGNIRELRNMMERSFALCRGDTIGLDCLPVERMTGSFATRVLGASPPAERRNASPPGPSTPPALKEEVRELERQRILDALARCAGNQTAAARLLGMSRRTLISRLGAFGIARPRKGKATRGSA